MAFIPLTALIVHTFYASKIWRREFLIILFRRHKLMTPSSFCLVSGENKLMIAPVIVLCLAEFGASYARSQGISISSELTRS
jgi:hypothetical protein